MNALHDTASSTTTVFDFSPFSYTLRKDARRAILRRGLDETAFDIIQQGDRFVVAPKPFEVVPEDNTELLDFLKSKVTKLEAELAAEKAKTTLISTRVRGLELRFSGLSEYDAPHLRKLVTMSRNEDILATTQINPPKYFQQYRENHNLTVAEPVILHSIKDGEAIRFETLIARKFWTKLSSVVTEFELLFRFTYKGKSYTRTFSFKYNEDDFKNGRDVLSEIMVKYRDIASRPDFIAPIG